jgi:hypothetical protein
MRRPDGSTCHLIAHEGEAQYEVLEQHLEAIGYTGPSQMKTRVRSTEPRSRPRQPSPSEGVPHHRHGWGPGGLGA